MAPRRTFKCVCEIIDESDPERERCTPIYRVATHPDEVIEGLQDDSIKTCRDIFELGRGRFPDKPFLGRRRVLPPKGGTGDGGDAAQPTFGEYEWLSYNEVGDLALRVGTRLARLGLLPHSQCQDEPYPRARSLRCVGLLVKNCIEWMVCDQAANAYNFTLVPLYDTLGLSSLSGILQATQLQTVLTSTVQLASICEVLNTDTLNSGICVKHLVLTDGLSTDKKVLSTLKRAGVTCIPWGDLSKPLEDGECVDPLADVHPEDVQTICYTSGTTGVAKGAIYTHKNICATVCGAWRGPFADSAILINYKDSHFSYLPLAHAFERIVCSLATLRSASIGFYSGDTKLLLDDLAALKPTCFVSVPRVFQRIDQRIQETVAKQSPIARNLFNSSMKYKLKKLKKDGSVSSAVLDSLFFRGIKNRLGQNIRYFVVGGARLDPDLQDRMKVMFSCPLVEGYGVTEVVGSCFCQVPSHPSGNIGTPFPSMEFKLRSVPEMDYYPTDANPRGELLLRGPSVTPGYFRNPEVTAEAFALGGWYCTGDVGELLPSGLLRLIDRKVSLFKLSQGEFIVPEKIESTISVANFVESIYVYGKSDLPWLVAIVHPSEAFAKAWGADNDVERDAPLSAYCANAEFHAAVAKEIETVSQGLVSFERVKHFYLTPEAFTPDNDLVTPTFKLRRIECTKKFIVQLEQLYEELRAQS
eukprot:Lankesteria_metandrocarpae@DN3735_c0_g1_i1.p1